MPRGRMLNKKISFDEEVAKISLKSALFFTWCIPNLDVGGKILGDLHYLKGTIVPYRKEFSPKVISECIEELQKSGLVIVYGNGYKYLKFKGFDKNQTINPTKEAESEIPNPTPEELQSNSGLTPPEVKLSKVKLSKDEEERKSIHPLEKWIKENLKNVTILENQLTNNECEKLVKEYDKELIKEVLWEMENYKTLTKKYKSVNLTLRNWIKIKDNRRESGTKPAKSHNTDPDDALKRSEEYKKHYPPEE